MYIVLYYILYFMRMLLILTRPKFKDIKESANLELVNLKFVLKFSTRQVK